MPYWRRKVVLLTGGSTGFGYVLAKTLCELSAQVVLVARDPDRLHRAAETLQDTPGQAIPVPADVTETFLVGLAAIYFLVRAVIRDRLSLFGIYCLLLGSVVLIKVYL